MKCLFLLKSLTVSGYHWVKYHYNCYQCSILVLLITRCSLNPSLTRLVSFKSWQTTAEQEDKNLRGLALLNKWLMLCKFYNWHNYNPFSTFLHNYKESLTFNFLVSFFNQTILLLIFVFLAENLSHLLHLSFSISFSANISNKQVHALDKMERFLLVHVTCVKFDYRKKILLIWYDHNCHLMTFYILNFNFVKFICISIALSLLVI